MSAPLVDETVPARAPWSGVVPAGATLRIVDLGGNQAVDCLFYLADDTTERYSAPETIVRQGSIFLTTDSVLRAQTGRPLLTVEGLDAYRAASVASPGSTVVRPLQVHLIVRGFWRPGRSSP